ncbi:MAG: polyprenyl diphosphate synthase [Mycoplasmoidaceae bacterium]
MKKLPNHVSFIMDGNGRWAVSQNKIRTYGHHHGAKRILPLLKKFIKLGIKNISFFAFSTDNFSRPKKEVNYLMNQIIINYDDKYINSLIENSICFHWVGFKENLSKEIINLFLNVQEKTKMCTKLNVYLFFNYSFSKELEDYYINQKMITKNIPSIDLLVRTSGEKRISNYCMNLLLYSEIIFEPTLWPDYKLLVFQKNLKEYLSRERRFGNVK